MENDQDHPNGLSGTKEGHLFRKVFDAIEDGMYVLDKNLNIVQANRRMGEIYSSKKILPGNRCHSVLYGKSSPCEECPAIKAMQTGNVHRLVMPFISNGKNYSRIELSAFPISDIGTVTGVVVYCKDVTAEKIAWERLNKSEQKYRSIFESMEQGYYEANLAGNFTHFNKSLLDLLGYSRQEMSNKNYQQVMDRENAEKVLDIVKKVYKTGEPHKGFVWEFIRKDGSIRQIGSSVSPIKNSRGRCVAFRGIARDISERKILENQLAQSKKLKSIGQLAAGIAHEINTPIQYVGDNTHFLNDAFSDILILLDKYGEMLEAVKSGGSVLDLVRDIEEAAEKADLVYIREEIPEAIRQSLEGLDRVAEIVQSMKIFSHPGNDRKAAVDINKAISSTITIARNEWKYIADAVTDFDASLPFVPCLPGEINQVFLNLIVNAAHAIGDVVEATKNKGVITISTRKDDDHVEIRITDTGSGIPEMIRPMIFDPFFTTKEVGKGTGQGLTLSHSVVVDKHGGAIRFETEMGKGTTFIVRLPL